MTHVVWPAVLLFVVSGCYGSNVIRPLPIEIEVDRQLASDVIVKIDGKTLGDEPQPLPAGKSAEIVVSFRKGTAPVSGKGGDRTSFDKIFGKAGLSVELTGSMSGQWTNVVGSSIDLRNGEVGAFWKSRPQEVLLPPSIGRYALTISFRKSLGTSVTPDGLMVQERLERHAIYVGTVELNDAN